MNPTVNTGIGYVELCRILERRLRMRCMFPVVLMLCEVFLRTEHTTGVTTRDRTKRGFPYDPDSDLDQSSASRFNLDPEPENI